MRLPTFCRCSGRSVNTYLIFHPFDTAMVLQLGSRLVTFRSKGELVILQVCSLLVLRVELGLLVVYAIFLKKVFTEIVSVVSQLIKVGFNSVDYLRIFIEFF